MRNLLQCFGSVKGISVRKFRRLVERIREELTGAGTGDLEFVGEFDVARSVYGGGSGEMGAWGNDKSMIVMEESTVGEREVGEEFLNKNKQLLEYIEYESQDQKLQKLAEIVREKQNLFQEQQ